MKVKDKIYIVNNYGTFLRSINYVGENHFEWKWGYAPIKDVTLNPNKKSKVKYIFKTDKLKYTFDTKN
jgi:hypothetical protein